MVDCPACKRSHGKLSPGIYKCPCTAQFRVDKNPAKKNPAKKNPARKNNPEYRKFNGELYELILSGLSKDEANRQAVSQRKGGRKARVLKGGPGGRSGKGYALWVGTGAIGWANNPAKKNPAGEEAIFMGYGGAGEYTTEVYSYRGIEIRIPTHPEIFPPEEVAEEYATFLADDLDSAIEEIDELAEDSPGAFGNPMGRTKPKPKHSPYDRAQRRARKTARTGAPASDENGAYPSPKMRRDNPEWSIVPNDPKMDIRNVEQLPRGTGARYLEIMDSHIPGEHIAVQWRRSIPKTPPKMGHALVEFSSKKKNPDEPRGYWDYAPLEVEVGEDVGYPDRPMEPLPAGQGYFDDNEWFDLVGPDKGGGNGHIVGPFTPRRHFGMFSFKGNRAVELFAQRWRDAYLEGRDLDWERDILPELEELASLPGLEEARDTDVREQIMAYIEEGDKVVEMDGETYHYPHWVTPDYYQD